MGWVIGIDEAGYGPNLGPLVISATAWRVPDSVRASDLYGLLAGVIDQETADDGASALVTVADSKAVYNPRRGLGLLERGVLAMVAALGHSPQDWRELWLCLVPDSHPELDRAPWHQGPAYALPASANAADVRAAARRLAPGLAAVGVRLVAVRSRAVFPAQFNALVQAADGKASALSRLSIALVAEVMAALPAGSAEVVCDKHGGRNCYGPLLQQQFPDLLIENFGECRDVSTYRFGPEGRRAEVRFCCRGESLLPIAAASMVSKYLRELSMRAFNDFWLARVPDLAPTAGYPSDSRRFKRGIARAQAELGIDDCILWRER
jgi:hypothetical protein